MLLEGLAKKIINEVKRLINEQIIIVNMDCFIIASTDLGRVGDFHEGALSCIKSKGTVIITKEMESHLRGVKSGINLPLMFQNEVVGVIGITGDPSNVSQYGELLRKMTELLIHENYYLEQLEVDQRSYEALIFDWIQNREWTVSFFDRANALGIDLTRRKLIILFSMNQDESLLQRKVWKHLQSMIDEQDLLIRWGNERFILVHSAKQWKRNEIVRYIKGMKEQCDRLYHINLSVGVGSEVNPKELPLSYEQAACAIEFSLKAEEIVFHEDLRLEICLQDIPLPTREEFLKRTLQGLREQKELLYTLRQFIEQDHSYKKTSECLNIHINSLHYRLKKIEDITGLNPKRFQDLVILYFALYFLDDSPKLIR